MVTSGDENKITDNDTRNICFNCFVIYVNFLFGCNNLTGLSTIYCTGNLIDVWDYPRQKSILADLC